MALLGIRRLGVFVFLLASPAVCFHTTCLSVEKPNSGAQERFCASSEIRVFEFSPDASQIAVGTDAGTAEIFDGVDGRCLHAWQAHERRVRSIVYSKDGTRIATEGDQGTIVWNAKTYQAICKIPNPKDGKAGYETMWSNSRVAFSGDGLRVAAYGSWWDAASGETKEPYGFHGQVQFGKTISAFPSRKALTISNSIDSTASKDFEVDGISAISLSDDEKLVALGQAYFGGGVSIFDTKQMKKVAVVPGVEVWIFSLDFSKDGEQLAIAGKSKGIWIYDIAQKKIAHELSTDLLNSCVRYSPDSKYLVASGTDRRLRRWSLPDYKALLVPATALEGEAE